MVLYLRFLDWLLTSSNKCSKNVKFIRFSIYTFLSYCIFMMIQRDVFWQKEMTRGKKIEEYDYFLSFIYPIFSFVVLTTYHAHKTNSVKVLSTIIPENVCCTMWAWCTPVLDFCYLREFFEKRIFLKGEGRG